MFFFAFHFYDTLITREQKEEGFAIITFFVLSLDRSGKEIYQREKKREYVLYI